MFGFKNGIVAIDDDGNHVPLREAFPAPSSDPRVRQTAFGCVAMWVVIVLCVSVLVAHSEYTERDGYGEVAAPVVASAPVAASAPEVVRHLSDSVKFNVYIHKGYRYYCHPEHCSSGDVGKHLVTHKLLKSAAAGGVSAASAAYACGGAALPETGPFAVIPAGACAAAAGVAGLVAGGAANYVESQTDDCVHACDLGRHVFPNMACAPDPDECLATMKARLTR